MEPEIQIVNFDAFSNKLQLTYNRFTFLEVIENDDNFASCTVKNFDSENEVFVNFARVNKYTMLNTLAHEGRLKEFINHSYYDNHLTKTGNRATQDYERFLVDIKDQIAKYVMEVSIAHQPL